MIVWSAPASVRSASPSATPSATSPSRRRHVVAIGAIMAIATASYATLGLVRLHTFRAGVFDLVIFDQAVRGYSRLGLPTAPARGVHNGFGWDFLQLGDHFSPILAVLAPFYWLHDGPATLLVAQAVLLAAAIPSLWLFTRRLLGTASAYMIAVAYAVSWPVTQAASFDFHEAAFAPVLTAVMIERFQAGRIRAGILAAIGLLLVKEDMGLLVAGFGAYLFVTRRRAVGAGFLVGGLAWSAVANRAIIPALGGRADYWWSYNSLGPDVHSVVKTLLFDPARTLQVFTTPDAKVATMLWLGALTLFACLMSPLTLAAVPLILERMLGDTFPNWWSTDYQYNAFIVIVLFCAGVDGVARIRRRYGVAWAALVLLFAIAVVPRFALADLIRPSFYARDARAVAAAEAVAKVPPGVLVEAANLTGAAISGRNTVLLWDDRSRGASWVIADVLRPTFPFTSVDEQVRRVAELKAAGFVVVFAGDGYVVLHQPPP